MSQLKTFHAILRELKLAGINSGTPGYVHLMKLYKTNQVTAGRYCRDQTAADYNALTFLTYLQSTRKLNNLCNYYNRGENSIKKAAERVGLRIPTQYSEHPPNENGSK
ncbi:unnamed protein product [Clavelina lepadiformis]|uniref:Protein FMC1 homolog n=1 Tax=Clavelina lepadiformis TaxID=159417 RepID=A0ABP0EWD5_CLALP